VEGQPQAYKRANELSVQMNVPSGDPDGLMCRELVELVTDYLEGALPPAERARFEAHMAECDGCRAYMSQIRRSVSTLGRLASHTLSADEQARLLALFRSLGGSVRPGEGP
jgi:Putative zinc-finger